MARIVKYLELLRKGAGKFVRELDSGFIIVSNEKVTENSFAIMKARQLEKVLGEAGRYEEAKDVHNALDAIKERTSNRYREVRSKRLS